mgnify:CR=1 FL=1
MVICFFFPFFSVLFRNVEKNEWPRNFPRSRKKINFKLKFGKSQVQSSSLIKSQLLSIIFRYRFATFLNVLPRASCLNSLEIAIHSEWPKSHRIDSSRWQAKSSVFQRLSNNSIVYSVLGRQRRDHRPRFDDQSATKTKAKIQDRGGRVQLHQRAIYMGARKFSSGDKKTIPRTGGAITLPIVKSRAGFVSSAAEPTCADYLLLDSSP